MMDKIYGPAEPGHVILVRAGDFAMEVRLPLKSRTSLSAMLTFLSTLGVKKAFVYDLSCSGTMPGQNGITENDYKLFGGD